MKENVIALMTPTETYMITVRGNGGAANEPPADPLHPPQQPQSITFDYLFEEFAERCREARSMKLLRPVFREEYFEAAWDIIVGPRPRLRKVYRVDDGEDPLEDLSARYPAMAGRKRLCVKNTALALYNMEIKPTQETSQPFDRKDFFDFPVSVFNQNIGFYALDSLLFVMLTTIMFQINIIANYGKQEKYFFIRIGRCAEYGQGEIWMTCESGDMAKYMHEKIGEINQREADRRKSQGIRLTL